MNFGCALILIGSILLGVGVSGILLLFAGLGLKETEGEESEMEAEGQGE